MQFNRMSLSVGMLESFIISCVGETTITVEVTDLTSLGFEEKSFLEIFCWYL